MIIDFIAMYILGLGLIVMAWLILFLINRQYGLYLGGAVFGLYTFPFFIGYVITKEVYKDIKRCLK